MADLEIPIVDTPDKPMAASKYADALLPGDIILSNTGVRHVVLDAKREIDRDYRVLATWTIHVVNIDTGEVGWYGPIDRARVFLLWRGPAA